MPEKEFDVLSADDLKDAEMKQVSAGETPALLAKVNGKIFALGAYCTHYGAPLVEGALNGERIICPLHHACFNIATGDLLEPPAMDALPRYEVRVADGRILIKVPGEPSDRRTPEMCKRDNTADTRTFVILGGGAAGYAAAQTLREDGFKGRISMITREDRLPYDRPNLSKDYLHGHAQPEWMPLRGDEFYDEYDIETMRGRDVISVDLSSKKIAFRDGESITYDKLLVATGGIARQLEIPGVEWPNVKTLRSFDDADSIIQLAREAQEKGSTRATVIGASFIGMEAAYSLTERGFAVTVIAPEAVPFERILGPEIGAMFQQLHEKHGVRFKLGANVVQFLGKDRAQAILLSSGERIDADLIVTGVGVKPATDFLRGIRTHKDGSVITNEYLQFGEDVYAAGDIARFPDQRTGEYTRIEHWRTAEQQGRVAAHNMAGKQIVYDSVPFFWTEQYGVSLRYVGHVQQWDEVIIEGNVAEHNFIACYVKNGRILAAAGCGRDRDLAAIEALMRDNRMPSPEELRKQQIDWVGWLKK
jgi:NADPH-dependent 2,4-dienoyl-CoA reductase/sulfur reductase-like enzyme/nitrite reductase/ring-hydroxylating ferredoxin subunit